MLNEYDRGPVTQITYLSTTSISATTEDVQTKSKDNKPPEKAKDKWRHVKMVVVWLAGEYVHTAYA